MLYDRRAEFCTLLDTVAHNRHRSERCIPTFFCLFFTRKRLLRIISICSDMVRYLFAGNSFVAKERFSKVSLNTSKYCWRLNKASVWVLGMMWYGVVPPPSLLFYLLVLRCFPIFWQAWKPETGFRVIGVDVSWPRQLGARRVVKQSVRVVLYRQTADRSLFLACKRLYYLVVPTISVLNRFSITWLCFFFCTTRT